MNYKISVVVPIYNVERFIEKCSRSLLRQTISDKVQYIFVDDCSPDKSIAILSTVIEEFPQLAGQIILMRHEQNKGLPASRNTGLSLSTGEYVFHCDADDFVESDAFESLMAKAEQEEADIVYSDWNLVTESGVKYMPQQSYADSQAAFKGILAGGIKFNVWNKLVKRSLYQQNKIVFPDGHSMGEDMTMIHLFAKARKTVHLSKATYNYVRLNTESFTLKENPQHYVDILFNANRCMDFIQSESIYPVSEKMMALFKLNVKYPFLISDKKASYNRWLEWFPESNQYVWENKTIGLRAKLLQEFARRKLFFLVKCHYYLLKCLS